MPPEGSKRKIKVIKVKSEVPINEIYPANFPVMPRLYLELIENKNNLYPLRKSFFVDECIFKNTIENFVPIGRNKERRDLYKQIVDKNRKNTLNFFKNI